MQMSVTEVYMYIQRSIASCGMGMYNERMWNGIWIPVNHNTKDKFSFLSYLKSVTQNYRRPHIQVQLLSGGTAP